MLQAEIAGRLVTLAVNEKQVRARASKNLPTLIKHMKRTQSAVLSNAADHPERPVRICEDCARSDDFSAGARNIAVATGEAMDTHENKYLRDPEDRLIDDCSEEQRKDKTMDKTLVDSFPASDPPAWQP